MDIQVRSNQRTIKSTLIQPLAAPSILMEEIDALFDQLPSEIKEAAFDLKSIKDTVQDEPLEEMDDEFEKDFLVKDTFEVEGDEDGISGRVRKESETDVCESISTGAVTQGRAPSRNTGLKSRLDADSFDATQLYLKEIGHVPLLSPEEELYYARLAVSGNERGRQRMIESNLRLVVKISRRYLNRGLPLLDLVEEGNLGLIHAVSKFDPEKGFRFSTYATWWIRQTIERALMSQVRTIRVPIHVMKEINQCLRAHRELSAKLNHEPSEQEVAELVGRPAEEVRKLLKLNEHITSLDITIGEEGSLQLSDVVANEHEDDPQSLLCTDDMTNHLNGWLDHLNDKQREIIARRFGLDGYEKKTLQKVGEDVGLTRERVRQIQVEALAKLRRLLEQNGINKSVACIA